jgi:hypothetical protein
MNKKQDPTIKFHNLLLLLKLLEFSLVNET